MSNSSDITFKPFGHQKDFLKSHKRILGAFAGKRGGKTEIGAVKSVILQETKPDWKFNGIDPYLGIIIAPTFDMLERLSWKKFMAYAKPFVADHTKRPLRATWHDNSEIIGISGDRPQRLEGNKANWIWIDEVFQCSEDLFLEARARIADSKGYIICTGSLGTQYINPKNHWAYKYFKINPDKDTQCFEWRTLDNPYFPQDELETLKNTLDPQSFRAMFEINWDTVPNNAVYGDVSEANYRRHNYNPALDTYVAIDWGWAHPMACLFFQYDKARDRVYLFDEIVESKLLLDDLYERIMSRGYNIKEWICDIAGNQEREQTGLSNINHFYDNYGISFKRRKTAINYGIPTVRSYIKNSVGVRRLFIDDKTCPKTLDGIRMYRYHEKDGIIQNENPVKEDDDAVDALRYFFVNILDPSMQHEDVPITFY